MTLMKGGCRSHCNGCMSVAWAMLWGGSQSTKPCVFPCKVAAGDDERYLLCCAEEARARNLVFFRVKWLQATMKGTSSVRRVRLRSFGSFYVFYKNGCSWVRSSMRFLKLWLQIALEWLQDCCMGNVVNVVGRKPEHETLCFSV